MRPEGRGTRRAGMRPEGRGTRRAGMRPEDGRACRGRRGQCPGERREHIPKAPEDRAGRRILREDKPHIPETGPPAEGWAAPPDQAGQEAFR